MGSRAKMLAEAPLFKLKSMQLKSNEDSTQSWDTIEKIMQNTEENIVALSNLNANIENVEHNIGQSQQKNYNVALSDLNAKILKFVVFKFKRKTTTT